MTTPTQTHVPHTADWKKIVAKYQQPSARRALWQVLNTVGPYALIWYLIYLTLGVSIWLTVPLVILAGGLLVRLFIIFHDCGHGSFFKSRRANDILGSLLGVLCFTPYYHWRWEHSVHHATSGDLDRRGTGDVWTMTVQEYVNAPWKTRLAYRFVRNPLVLLVLAPMFLFLVRERFPTRGSGRREKLSVYLTNAGIATMALLMTAVLGWKAYLLAQVSAVLIAGSAGVWLFYVQHQFEDVYWERGENWDYSLAALHGSSFYKLAKVLQWFSGNIGYHHVHHLSPRIPNYNLERCHNSEPLFQTVKPITLASSLRCINFRLWDEHNQKLVSFRGVREFKRRARLPRVRLA